MKITIIPAKTNKQTLKIAAYCRVSKSTEEQLNSIIVQKAYYEDFIHNLKDCEYAGVFVDIGKSGLRKKGREEFSRMIRLAKKKNIDLILVKSVSRLSRNTLDLLKIVQELRKREVYFYFEIEKIHTKDISKDMILTLLVAQAQEESMEKSKNITWGIRVAMRNGEYKMKKLYGFDVIDNRLCINTKEAEVVKMIFEMYANLNFGASKIIKVLEDKEILSPRGLKKWSCKSIIEILKNETYKGEIVLQKTFTKDTLSGKRESNKGQLEKYRYTNSHNQIVDEELFSRANELRLNKNFGNQKENQFKPQYILSKILKCGECGSNYSRRKERGKIVYRCSKRMHHGIDKCPTSVTLNENEVFGEIRKYLKVEDLNNIVIEDNIKSIIIYENFIEFIIEE